MSRTLNNRFRAGLGAIALTTVVLGALLGPWDITINEAAASTPPPDAAPAPSPQKPECMRDSDCQAGQFVCIPGETPLENACGDPCIYLPRGLGDTDEMGCVYAARMTNNTRHAVRQNLLKMKGHPQRLAEGKRLAKLQGRTVWTYVPDRIRFPANSTPADRRRTVLGGTKGGVRSDPMNPSLVVQLMKAAPDGFELVGVAEKAARRAAGGVRKDVPEVVDDALEVSTQHNGRLDRFVKGAITAHEHDKVHAEPAALDAEGPPAPSAVSAPPPPPEPAKP